MKYLLVLIVVGFVLWLMLGRRPPARRRDARSPGQAQPMVRCAHCGVHLPRNEALLLGDQAYCSSAHRDAGARTQ
jgi:uncharacterized protein